MPLPEQLPPWLVEGIARAVLDDVPTPMAVLDVDLRHVAVNAAMARLYEVPADTVARTSPEDLLGDLGWEVMTRCAQALEGRAAHGHQVRGVRQRGSAAEVHWQLDCTAIQVRPGRVGALLLTLTDLTARTRAMRALNDQRRRLAHQAGTDALTGVANRHRLVEHLGRLLEQGVRPRVLVVDLDGFKAVNDVHGHAAGDAVLVAVAQRLGEAVRRADLVCRYGGDEFVVVTADHEVEAEQVAGRLLAHVRRPVEWGGAELVVGASVGWAVVVPGDDVEAVLSRADAAMYRMKQRRTAAR